MTEKEIIAGCLKKDAACQRLLFDLYSRKLMSICLRYAGSSPEAEDMLQDSFIRIFTSIHQFRFEGSFEGWLKKITVNTCLGKFQKLKIRYDDISNLETDQFFVEPETVSSLNEKDLTRMIASLPEGYRIIFNLSVIEGYSHEEIASLLNIQAVTSRSQLMKARRMLQQQLSTQKKMTLKHEG